MDYFRILFFFFLISVSLSKESKEPKKPIRVPKMVAFDLDFTLWPFWIDVDVIPPFHVDKVGDVVDLNGKQVKCFPEALAVLKHIHDKQILIGAFSKSYDIDGAKQLIDLFGWSKYFTHIHLFKGDVRYINQANIEALAKEAKIDVKDILFIDDIYRNIVDFENLEVPSYLTSKGVTLDDMKLALLKFSDFSHRITEESEIRREKKRNATKV